MPYYKNIEWEIFESEKIFKNPEWNFEFPFKMSKISEIRIKRNEFYKLSIEIKCPLNDKLCSEMKQFNVIDFIKIKNNYTSDEFLIKKCNILQYGTSNENSVGFKYILLSAIKIIFNIQKVENISWVKEWYINGPQNIIFHRSTSYNKKVIYEKELTNPSFELRKGNKFKIETNEICYTSLNYMFCKLDENHYIMISRVPSDINPKWSNNICISYGSEDYINNKELRNDIGNIISFLFGKKLIKVAESYYDDGANKIKEEIINPFINQNFNIKNICERSEKFPIPFNRYCREDIELVMSDIIKSFIEKREVIDFSSMFANYWNSSFLPPESRIILLAASLESIKNKWFESKNSKSKGVIMDKSTYKKLIKDIKKLFMEKFGECKSLVDKFNQLNRLSIKKGLETFLEEINICIGDIEVEAINARNNPAHGNDIDTEGYCNLIIFAEVYQIILNRVILTLLDYEREYHVHDNVSPILISDNIPYSLEELRDEIYRMRYYEIE